jgi:hypothetical protein
MRARRNFIFQELDSRAANSNSNSVGALGLRPSATPKQPQNTQKSASKTVSSVQRIHPSVVMTRLLGIHVEFVKLAILRSGGRVCFHACSQVGVFPDLVRLLVVPLTSSAGCIFGGGGVGAAATICSFDRIRTYLEARRGGGWGGRSGGHSTQLPSNRSQCWPVHGPIECFRRVEKQLPHRRHVAHKADHTHLWFYADRACASALSQLGHITIE